MPEGSLITIRLQIKGKTELQRLNSEIAQLNKMLKKQTTISKIADRQQQVYAKRLKLSNAILKEKINGDQQHFKDIAKELNLQQDLNEIYEGKIEVERRVLRAKEDAARKGIAFNEESARRTIEAQVKEEMAYKRVQEAINAKRKALMQTSISLFVLNISANQLVSSLKPLVKENEAATKALEDMQAMLNLTLGPLQFYLALLQIQEALQLKAATTAKLFGTAMAGTFLMMMAIRQEAPALRAALGAISGALLALSIMNFMNALSEQIKAGAILTSIMTRMGGPVGFIAGMAMAGAGIALVTGWISKAKSSYETPLGGMKRVGRTGLAMVHEGEIFGRPSMSMTSNNSMTMNLYFGPGTSRDDADYISQAVYRAVARGRGSMTSGGISLG